jgi:hypothetical protein
MLHVAECTAIASRPDTYRQVLYGARVSVSCAVHAMVLVSSETHTCLVRVYLAQKSRLNSLVQTPAARQCLQSSQAAPRALRAILTSLAPLIMIDTVNCMQPSDHGLVNIIV